MLAAIFNKFILIPVLAFMSSSHGEDQIPKEDRIILDIINETAGVIEKKYGAHPIGFGMSGHFKYLEISFEMSKVLDKEEIRLILLDCVDMFLSRINSSETAKPYLKKHPFDFENAGIQIFFHDPDGRKVFHPNIAVAGLTKRGLDFQTNDPEHKYRYKETYEETHEEAIAKVKAQHPEFKFGSWSKVGISDQSSKIE